MSDVRATPSPGTFDAPIGLLEPTGADRQGIGVQPPRDPHDPGPPSGRWAATALASSPLSAATRSLTGAGVDVAVIDTGVHPVPGLDDPDKVVRSGPRGPSTIADGHGHGTVMAGLVAGSVHGVAADARIVDVRVADDGGAAGSDSVAAGLRWLIEHGRSSGLDVRIALAAFDDGAADPDDGAELLAAIEQARRAGIAVLVGAGDRGTDGDRLTGPARAAGAIVVSATTASGEVAPWARRGDRDRSVDAYVPGSRLLAPIHPGALIARSAPAAVGEVDGVLAIRGSGTSHAAALAAGVAARMLEASPWMGPNQLRRQLTRWAGARASNSWTSNSWTSNSWTSNSWTSNSWTSNSWTSNSWTSNSWTSNSWTSNSWTSNSWT
ncbi:MAG: S8 family serine peptidase [Actinomycetota bacterium]